jgi:hypothetical protein
VYSFSDVLLMKENVDQHFGGSFNADKNWKKLREKHRKAEASRARGVTKPHQPETYRTNNQIIEGSERIIPKELYDLNYDLAFGRITEEQYEHKRAEFDLGQ